MKFETQSLQSQWYLTSTANQDNEERQHFEQSRWKIACVLRFYILYEHVIVFIFRRPEIRLFEEKGRVGVA